MIPREEVERKEAEVFAKLARLARTPGYAHAIAAICFRDNVISFGDKPDFEKILSQYSESRLLRTEISTLIGLLIQVPIDIELPEPQTLQEMIDRTDELMLELHHSINGPAFDLFQQTLSKNDSDNPFTRGAVLRESIFYGGESAYLFQYRDLAVPKYVFDNEWLLRNKGFTIEDARAVLTGLIERQSDKLSSTLESFRSLSPHLWTVLPGFTFTVSELANSTGLPDETVRSVITAFTVPDDEKNSGFKSVGDFNVANASPLLRIGEDEYLCFQAYSIAEALYESPFYWMGGDKAYVSKAAEHRGQFTENFCAERLKVVFGPERVLKNVSIYRGKKRLAEIDVLVLFADRAIIVEAKSKRLTIEARKGNDNQLQDDFKQGIQAAYNQARASAVLLADSTVDLKRDDGTQFALRMPLAKIYIFCVLSDHYPALAFQSRNFLKIEATDVVKPPFVMDVFTLDTIAEMLATPLYFLSYIDKRADYADRIMASHELTVLSYHLKRNLWIEQENSLFHLHDDIGADLDLAMMVRREGLPGERTPAGILTKFERTSFRKLVAQIEHAENSAMVKLGFLLLSLNEYTIEQLSAGLDEVCRRSMLDGGHHDITIGINEASAGVSVHANFDRNESARLRLASHCQRRKYAQHAGAWYGLCLDPSNGDIRFGLSLESPWMQSDEMDALVANLPIGGARLNLTSVLPKQKKVGRNDPCPCRSGKKYKKCCLHRR